MVSLIVISLWGARMQPGGCAGGTTAFVMQAMIHCYPL